MGKWGRRREKGRKGYGRKRKGNRCEKFKIESWKVGFSFLLSVNLWGRKSTGARKGNENWEEKRVEIYWEGIRKN